MLIFDQLKKHDPQLRLLALVIFGGVCILVAGLWWVQIVKAGDFQAHLETQSFRTVRIPAVRGKILDRNGEVLAENRPVYDIGLYLEELSPQFQQEFTRLRPVRSVTNSVPFWKRWLGGSSVTAQRVRLRKEEIDALSAMARYIVASNVVNHIGRCLQQPISLSVVKFTDHYNKRRALPYPILEKLDASTIARFEEQSTSPLGVDLEIQSTRVYPYANTAAHLLGELHRDDSSKEGEDADFNYRMPDYHGVTGIECGFDAQLRGRAGAKSVLVNNLGYRQTENIWSPAEPGSNVVLTIDVRIQRAAEHALQRAADSGTPRGAAVVMDVQTGDILALASSPAFNPNDFARPISSAELQQLQASGAEKNRATQENYAPGSIFKTVIALACLDSGLDPNAIYEVQPNPQDRNHGIVYVGRRSIKDTVPPGPYDFKHALIHSSNAYFVTNGLRAGIENIANLARHLHLGEGLNLLTRQETPGSFPSWKRIHSGWSVSDTASLCIGQGEIDVTPLQMTVLASALANGGKVLWPRLVDRVEPQDPLPTELPRVFPKGQVRDVLPVKPASMRILQEAMLADVEEEGGTGSRLKIPGYHICSKTGTAQVMDEKNKVIGDTTWVLSFAPYENPRYAVVVMIETKGGGSGGATCAPLAREIYEAILKTEQPKAPQTLANTK